MSIASPAVRPPIAPMLARLVRELPAGNYLYEPKWDGFRALIFREADAVEIQSRHERPFARYFPELVEAALRVPAASFVLDGEIVIVRNGRFDFPRLMLRTHPAASRVRQLAAEAPALFIGFDLLAVDGHDLREAPFAERRVALEDLLGLTGAGIRLTPATRDLDEARRWLGRFTGNGVDGVVAKDLGGGYEPGKRAMLKVKVERTADCVVAGFRVFPGRLVASLLLGLYDERGTLVHVGVAASFTRERRAELFASLSRLAVDLEGHPWECGFGLEGSPVGRLKGAAGRWEPGMSMDWVAIAPIVAEVAYDTLDGRRFRHPARFKRWRPDREPRSCTFDQLPAEVTDLERLIPTT